MTTENKGTDSKIGNIYEILKSKKAPDQIGKPIYRKDMEMVRQLGVNNISDIIGASAPRDEKAVPLNFGSKKSTGLLPEETRQRLFQLKKMYNNVEIQAKAMACQDANGDVAVTPDMFKAAPWFKNFLEPMLKAFSIDDFSSWVPTVNARFFFEEYELPHILADQFDQLPMESKTVDVPGVDGHLEGVEEADKAIFTEQSNTETAYQVTARNNVVHTCLGEDLNQDSVPAIIDHIRREVMMGLLRSEERALVNGDDTGSPRGNGHFDSDLQALALNQTFAKAYKGLRRRAYDNDSILGGGAAAAAYNHAGAVPDKDLFANMLKLMKVFASEKDMLCWILPTSIETDLVTGAIPELFTAFAFGGLASNVTGQVPPVFGIRPVTSQYMREDMTAGGVYDGVTTDFTGMLLVHKGRFQRWVRQATRIWATPSLANSDQLLMAGKNRISFGGVPQSEKELSVVYGYNVAKS